jgi:cytochrome oxidase assembly protein ShyY1
VFRRLFTPRWLLGLLLTLAGAAGMVRLGMWQLGRGEQRHSLQNYSYAVEWVLFAAFTVFCFGKLLRDEGRDVDEPDAVSAAVVVPPPALPVDEPADDELAAYNAYLARLNESA